MAKIISDFDKYAASLSEIINPEIRAELEGIYKDNSATFNFFKGVDKSVQEILRNSAIGADDLKQLKNALTILAKLEIEITKFASKKLSKAYNREMTKLIDEIKGKMSFSEIEDKNRHFFELLEKNKQALKDEWQPPKRFTDQFFHDEIAKLWSSISTCENQISSLPYEIQSAMNEENRIRNEQQQALNRYHAMGYSGGFADSYENRQFSDMFKRVWDRKHSAEHSIRKYRELKTEYERKKRELERQLGYKEEERLRRYYQDLLDRKQSASKEEEFIELAKEFIEFEGYYDDAEELTKECEEMPRKMQYNKLLRAQILAKTEKEFREIAKESRSLSMKFKDKEFLELAKECTNRADKIAEQEKKNKYNKLIQEYKRASTEKDFSYLEAEFCSMNGYENTAELAEKCAEQHRVFKERREKQEKKDEYDRLVQAKNNASKEQLLDLAKRFRAMNGYENTAELANECVNQCRVLEEKKIQELNTIRKDIAKFKNCISVSGSPVLTVGLKTDGTVVAVGSDSRGECNTGSWREIVAISSSGASHTVGLKADGTVVAVGDNRDGLCNTKNWTDIVAISSRHSHTVGLKADGTVVAVGWNKHGECNTKNWTDIVAISTKGYDIKGLKADGTVITVGDHSAQRKGTPWKDIVAIFNNHITVKLQADGTVVAVGRNFCKECHTDIVAIDGDVVLKTDGTVIGGDKKYGNKYGQYNTEDWRDIVAISSSGFHTVGLKADGTVIAVGANNNGECNTKNWKDIVAISSSSGTYDGVVRGYTVGLKRDGTVVAVGWNKQGQCNTENWKGIGPPSEEQILKWERRAKGLCQSCGGKMSGLFTKKCKVCGKPR